VTSTLFAVQSDHCSRGLTSVMRMEETTLRCWRTKYPYRDNNGNRGRAAEITIRAPEIRQLIKWCNGLSDVRKFEEVKCFRKMLTYGGPLGTDTVQSFK